VFQQHLAGDTQAGCAFDKGRHVGSADDDQLNVIPGGLYQLAAGFRSSTGVIPASANKAVLLHKSGL
jgi:hypothetical protein